MIITKLEPTIIAVYSYQRYENIYFCFCNVDQHKSDVTIYKRLTCSTEAYPLLTYYMDTQAYPVLTVGYEEEHTRSYKAMKRRAEELQLIEECTVNSWRVEFRKCHTIGSGYVLLKHTQCKNRHRRVE